jgi:hypothetical protein
MKIDDLLDRLERVRPKSGGGWTARCPAHEDKEPSLSIDQRNDAILLHCFAGCSVDTITQRLGLDLADLFVEPRPLAAASNGVARTIWYDGRDINGEIVARHKRVEQPGKKKRMSWWLPGATEAGLNGLPTNSLALFDITQLPDWPATAPIIIVEGEKAATVLVQAGVPALGTMTGAEGCPSVEMLVALAGRRVILWPDNDKPGEMHMTRLGKRLIEAGVTSIKWFTWIDAGDGGDAADYLAGRSVDQLRTDIAQAYRWPVDQKEEKQPSQPSLPSANGTATKPRRGITAAELQRRQFEPLRWIVEGMVPEGALLIAGRPKSKKSWMALGLAIAVAMNGRAFGSKPVTPGRVLYLDLEGNQRRIQDRMRTILGRETVDWPDRLHIVTAGEWPEGEAALPALADWFDEFPDTTLAIIDVLQDFRPAIKKNENPYDYDRNVLKAINQLAEARHACIIVVHHTRKAKGEYVQDEISGTLGAPSAVATYWVLSRSDDGQHTILTPNGRDLRHDDTLALAWDPLNCIHTIEGKAQAIAISTERQLILKFLADDQPHSPKEIALAIGKTVNAIQLLLIDMLQDGQIDKVGIGKYARIPLT